jgi:hypothetical protein
MKSILVNIQSCARCGHDHSDISFTKFTEEEHAPIGQSGSVLTHFATCPTYGEPILMRIVETTE